MKIRVVKFAVYLVSLDLAEGYLLFDEVKHHEKVFAFLSVTGFRVGEGYRGTVVLHYDGR
jgi:hypothetical protein